MNKLNAWFKENFVNGFNLFDKIYLVTMLILQVATFFLAPMDDARWIVVMSFITGILGVVSVVLCAKKNIWFYLFGFLQNALYMIVVWNQHLYLEFGEYIFYNATMIYGIYVWKKNLEDGSKSQVVGKKMSVKAWIYSIAATVIATVGFGLLDNYVFKGAVPYLDAFTISFTVIAQILMVLCYRDQWVFWFILDIASIATFAALKNWPLMAMYVAWTINCVYGWIEWSKKNNGGK